jgi:putative ATP-dependent endonuclease of OLD family
MIYIKSVHIENYKCFENLDINFNKNVNIIVGNNEAGKSTILEAINLCLSGTINNRYLRNELNEYFFNTKVVKDFLSNSDYPPPKFLIEVYLDSDDLETNKNLEILKGSMNSRKEDSSGIKLEVCFDDKYQKEYSIYKQTSDKKAFPVEYYKIVWSGFSQTEVSTRSIPLKPNVIDASGTKYKNGSDYYISKIISNQLDSEDIVELTQAIRGLKEKFKNETALKKVNDKIAECNKISEKQVSVSVNTTEINAWESLLNTYIDDIPFTQIGQGEKSIIKTNLALSTIKENIDNVVLIEEPENHLSHSNLNGLLKTIEDNNSERQVIITTHSSFVANKLGLHNLLFINDKKVSYFNDVEEDTQKYFKKLAGFETLRVILSNKSILVEGPSDELIVQKAYQIIHNNHLPIEDGIDVISVKGIQARRFLKLAKDLPVKIAVVTDNDGDYAKNITERYKDFISDTVQVFSNKNDVQNTLEPSFVACNDEDDLKTFLNYTGEKPISEYMQTCKSEWAYQIFYKDNQFNFPDYINECIKWISQ